MIIIMVIIPNLGLQEKSDSELGEYAENKAQKLTGNGLGNCGKPYKIQLRNYGFA